MQGYILSTTSIKNQDLIVKILTKEKIKRLYRFYGLRHSIIGVGKKIDFEVEHDGLFLPRLRNIMHLGFEWERIYDRVGVWQHFVRILNNHLVDVESVDRFYFDLLEDGANRLLRQNSIRVVLELAISLFRYEGREFCGDYCFVCNGKLGDRISLGRAFLFAHNSCIGGDTFLKEEILKFIEDKKTLHLDDKEIERLWFILKLGL